MTHRTPYSNIEIVIFATGPTFPDPAFCNATTYGGVAIVNRGILEHVLIQAEKEEFPNITLVCVDKDKHAYQGFLTQTQHEHVRLLSLAPDDDPDQDTPRSTCAIIRKLGTDRHIIVVPIDLVTTTKFSPIVDFHLAHKSSVTMVASSSVFPDGVMREAPGTHIPIGTRYAVYDEADPSRVVTLLSSAAAIAGDVDLSYRQGSETDVDEQMTIHQAHLTRCRSLVVDGSKRFPGLFVVAPSALRFLNVNAQMHSIESELIPGLCLEAEQRIEAELAKRTQVDRVKTGEEPKPHKEEKKAEKPEPIPIVSLMDLPKEDYAFRICDYPSLYIANMMAARKQLKGFIPPCQFVPLLPLEEHQSEGYYMSDGLPQLTPSANCVYGRNLGIKDGVTITRSIIGPDCSIGEGCALVNVILFPGSRLGPKVQLTNCVVGALSTIGANCSFRNCVVAYQASPAAGRSAHDTVVLSHEVEETK
jgi:hypothetical protein